MLKYSSLLFKGAVFVAACSPHNAFSVDYLTERKPFYLRYEEASRVVFGEIVSVKPADSEVSEFKGLDPKFVFKAKMKIQMTFKGAKRQKNLEFYFYQPSGLADDHPSIKRALFGVTPRASYLLYLHDVDGKNIADGFWGASRFSRDQKVVDDPVYKALKDLAAGKEMAAAVKHLRPKEQKAFEDKQTSFTGE